MDIVSLQDRLRFPNPFGGGGGRSAKLVLAGLGRVESTSLKRLQILFFVRCTCGREPSCEFGSTEPWISLALFSPEKSIVEKTKCGCPKGRRGRQENMPVLEAGVSEL